MKARVRLKIEQSKSTQLHNDRHLNCLITYCHLSTIQYVYVENTVVVIFFLPCEDFGGIFDHSFPVCAFIPLFLKWRLACAHQFHSSGQDQSTVAQRAETEKAPSHILQQQILNPNSSKTPSSPNKFGFMFFLSLFIATGI